MIKDTGVISQSLLRRSTNVSLRAVCIGSALFVVTACNDLAGNPPLPAGIQDPEAYATSAGALQQAKGATRLMREAVMEVVKFGGMFTDEFVKNTAAPRTADQGIIDRRLENNGPTLYKVLHDVRAHSRLARYALLAYAKDTDLAIRGLMHAIEGYAEIYLADSYCSGIPLSTVDFPVGYTYRAGVTTPDVYRHAAELLDSAISLSPGNDSIETLARVGLGRALMGIGLYDSAARVVAPVSSSSTFRFRVIRKRIDAFPNNFYIVSDREGQNGMPFVSSFDPRTHTTTMTVGNSPNGYSTLTPTKYNDIQSGDSTSVIIASGVEARLIEAEADLARSGSQWLSILNALRTNGTTTVRVRADVPGQSPGPAGYPDTTWGPGEGVGLIAPSAISDNKPVCSAGVPCTDTIWYRGLRPLNDPGVGLSDVAAKEARVNLVFSERAFWLFATGHRQGDLRRLIRQYGRTQDTVYPTGSYLNFEGFYGDAVVIGIPVEERQNPYFQGCKNHGA